MSDWHWRYSLTISLAISLPFFWTFISHKHCDPWNVLSSYVKQKYTPQAPRQLWQHVLCHCAAFAKFIFMGENSSCISFVYLCRSAKTRARVNYDLSLSSTVILVYYRPEHDLIVIHHRSHFNISQLWTKSLKSTREPLQLLQFIYWASTMADYTFPAVTKAFVLKSNSVEQYFSRRLPSAWRSRQGHSTLRCHATIMRTEFCWPLRFPAGWKWFNHNWGCMALVWL